MLTGIHFLLTYNCNFECDHCFLFCSPRSKGTFTISQINTILNECSKIDSLEWIYFEGGEPFLYYPLMIQGIKLAIKKGFKVGIVTNSYWATSIDDAKIWLQPFKDLKLGDISISDDSFHYEDELTNLSKFARQAALELNLPVEVIEIEKAKCELQSENNQVKGTPVTGGSIMLRGRAVENLSEDLPRTYWEELTKCPYEDLIGLGRIHLDCFGNAHVCQGLSIGNFWKITLPNLIDQYNPKEHPICGPLLEGGPAELVRRYNLTLEEKYGDECHLCYMARKALINRFPEYLAPSQVYGL